jgi:hypothetical protein
MAEPRDDVMLKEDVIFVKGEDVAIEREEFFLLTRAADENVAGKIKLMEINSKHFAIRGVLFVRRILHNGSDGKCL